MAPLSSTQVGGFRRGLSMHANRLRRKFRHHSDDTGTQSPRQSNPDHQVIVDSQTSDPASDVSEKLISADVDGHAPQDQTSLHTSPLQLETTDVSQKLFVADIDNDGLLDQTSIRAGPLQPIRSNGSTADDDISTIVDSTDLWSAAYREAVESFGKDIDVAILKGSSAAQLLEKLEDVDKQATQESVFLRGVAYLRSIQIPLERFKLALDLAAPLGSVDPTASTVLGVVRSVTAVAISCATADLEFAKQIGDMLKQIQYIDECDTLGQRSNKTDIHQALVSVYREILEFYKAAHEMLSERGRKLVIKMVLETDRLPNIVQSFLEHAETLRKLIEKATWEIVEDMKMMLYDNDIAKWLDSGRMTVQNRNHARLQELRANEACEFLLAHPNLVEWYRASNTQQLVIFGEMGSGKTVSMAYLVDELNRRNEHQLPRPKICYYYCHDNDTGEIINILSGLTLSLLQQLSGLKKTFHNWYKENQACGIPEPSTNPRLLKEFLESVVVSLDRQLFIAIDGLDECDRSSRRNLLKYFNTLSNKTPRLKILLSSRPEEEILNQLSLIPRIDMESNAGRDIIIVRHTVEERLYYLSKDVSKLVIDTLSRLAKGSAIWSKMAVEFIESRGIRAIEPMRRFLDEMPLPGELSSLYDKLILRNSSNDAENQELATIALKLLAVSSRPLSIQELAWAVALAAAQPKVNTIAALSQLVDHQRIMGLIHPFISRIDYSDLRKRQVRLVHQSVKEYVVQKSSRQQGPATSLRPDQASTYGNTEDLEAFALGICIDYLMLDEVDSTPLFTPEQMAIEELPQDFDLFGDRKSFEYDVNCTWDAWEEDMILYDPTDRGFGEFFVYASSHWLKHLGAVRSQPFPPLTKMESLCQAGSLRIWNWINQNCRPGCAIKPRFEFYSELYDPLSITSLYGSDRLLRDMLSNANFDDDKYLPSTAMGAADQILWWGNLSRLKILFYEGKLGHQLRNLGFFERIIKQWYHTRARHENWEEAFSLVDSVLDTMVEEQWGHDLLATAARSGCMPVVQRLLSKARHNTELRNELLRAPQVLGEAVLGDRLGVVEYILREKGFEAYLEYLNSNGENLLHLASAHCNPEIFRLLAPRLQHHIHQIDNHGDTPLVAIVKSNASSTNRYESARIIFSRNNPADSGHDHERHQKALQVAVQLGEIEMCRLLIAEGRMDPLSALVRGSDGQLILRSEPDMNKEAILKFLLEQRIDSAL